MKTYLEMIKSFPNGGEDIMWKMVENLSSHLEKLESAHPELYKDLIQEQYAIVNGPHFNEEFALDTVAKFYSTDADGTPHKGEYWTLEETSNVFEQEAKRFPSDMNRFDFYVLLNMIKSDFASIVGSWFMGEDNTDKYIALAENWYSDEDRPYKTIWEYLMG